jgi:hypothetical protein
MCKIVNRVDILAPTREETCEVVVVHKLTNLESPKTIKQHNHTTIHTHTHTHTHKGFAFKEFRE